jgi:phosphoglycerate dehydrogenase-like enzyme
VLRKAFVANAFAKHNRVILTPHVAYDTEEATERRVAKVIETVEQLNKGKKKLYNKVA